MFDKAEQNAEDLEQSHGLLDQWKKRGDDLLYSMMPKAIADRLRTGASALDTCEVFAVNLKKLMNLLGNFSKV